mgnify:CR=1 FL=1
MGFCQRKGEKRERKAKEEVRQKKLRVWLWLLLCGEQEVEKKVSWKSYATRLSSRPNWWSLLCGSELSEFAVCVWAPSTFGRLRAYVRMSISGESKLFPLFPLKKQKKKAQKYYKFKFFTFFYIIFPHTDTMYWAFFSYSGNCRSTHGLFCALSLSTSSFSSFSLAYTKQIHTHRLNHRRFQWKWDLPVKHQRRKPQPKCRVIECQRGWGKQERKETEWETKALQSERVVLQCTP